MSSLTPEAYAVIEGRPSDPFHYLGPHVDDDGSVVRVFLPDAEGSASIPSSTCASRPVSTVSIGSQI
jgi:1,4-alpha-glucan branching enzyme